VVLSLDGLPQIPPDPRRNQLLRALREAIIVGALKPGDRIVERDVAERTGISRGPVREAVRQLEQEGLVVSVPYRGTEVASVSQEEIEQILVPIRLVLERFAFRHALPLMSDKDFEELEKIVEALRHAARNDDLAGVVDGDVRFHELVFARANQPHCAQVWGTIVPRVRAYFYRDAAKHEPLEHLANGHDELLSAMRERDVAKLLPVLDEHILETLRLAEGDDRSERVQAALDAIENIGPEGAQ
jgi:DNA-binding GntR family transcriptional regulator